MQRRAKAKQIESLLRWFSSSSDIHLCRWYRLGLGDICARFYQIHDSRQMDERELKQPLLVLIQCVLESKHHDGKCVLVE